MAIVERSVDILLCPYWATWSAVALRRVLESIMDQECVDWRLIMVDGTADARVEAMTRAIIPAERLEYEVPLVRNVQQPTLYWQAIMGARARYIAYADARATSGLAWNRLHLFMLSDLLNRGRADVVFSSDQDIVVEGAALRGLVASESIVPLGALVHRSDVYARLLRGWDRCGAGDMEHEVLREMMELDDPPIDVYHFAMETARSLVAA